jgi:hypothetical protein
LALLARFFLARIVVAARLDERVAAVDHAGAGFFAQALDLVGVGL